MPGSRRAQNIWGVGEINERLSLLCPAFSYRLNRHLIQASSVGNIYDSTSLVYQVQTEVLARRLRFSERCTLVESARLLSRNVVVPDGV
jgi:hypothetical protein